MAEKTSSKSQSSTLLGTLFIVLFMCGIGGAMFAGNFDDLRDSFTSLDWKKAQGEVISAGVETSTDSEGDASYRARVTYFYYAGDDRYESDRVRFGDDITSSSYGNAQDTVDKYSIGKRISIYYNPDQPNDAVIERRPTLGLFALTCVSSIISGIGLLVLRVGIQEYFNR